MYCATFPSSTEEETDLGGERDSPTVTPPEGSIIVACLRQGRPFLDFLIRGLLLPSKYISKEGTQDFVGHRADLFLKCLVIGV